VRALIDHGYREIVLSGIHMGHFGVDTNNLSAGSRPERLWHLLRRLDRIPGDWRMRLSSIEAVEVNEEFIRACGDCQHLCPQFHPALQSGSDAVLTRMRRRYRVQRFLERLQQMRDLLGPQTAFSTDVIVGFPGETEREFEETLETCRVARFMKVHVFPFSRRDGTPAATMEGQISPREIRRRVQVLGDLERGLAEQYYLERVADSRTAVQSGAGQHEADLQVLAERPAERGEGWLRGTDRWYMPVEFPGTLADLGSFVRCRAVSADRTGVLASRLDPLRSEESGRVQISAVAEAGSDEVADDGVTEADSCCGSGLSGCDVSELPLVSLGTAGFTGVRL